METGPGPGGTTSRCRRRDEQGSLKLDRAARLLMNRRKQQFQTVVFQSNLGGSTLPFPVTNLAYHSLNGVVGRALEVPD